MNEDDGGCCCSDVGTMSMMEVRHEISKPGESSFRPQLLKRSSRLTSLLVNKPLISFQGFQAAAAANNESGQENSTYMALSTSNSVEFTL